MKKMIWLRAKIWLNLAFSNMFMIQKYDFTKRIGKVNENTLFLSMKYIKADKKAGFRTKISALDSIVRIRTNLYFNGRCCKDFRVTEGMLSLFNAQQMYLEGSNDNSDEERDILETLWF